MASWTLALGPAASPNVFATPGASGRSSATDARARLDDLLANAQKIAGRQPAVSSTRHRKPCAVVSRDSNGASGIGRQRPIHRVSSSGQSTATPSPPDEKRSRSPLLAHAMAAASAVSRGGQRRVPRETSHAMSPTATATPSEWPTPRCARAGWAAASDGPTTTSRSGRIARAENTINEPTKGERVVLE